MRSGGQRRGTPANRCYATGAAPNRPKWLPLKPPLTQPRLPIYNRIGMGLEVWVYAGLTKAENAEVDRDGYLCGPDGIVVVYFQSTITFPSWTSMIGIRC